MKRFIYLFVLLFIAMPGSAQENPGKYEMKSGVIKNVVSVLGQKTESMLYFDGYGTKEMTKTKMSIPGMGEMEISSISKDGKIYVVNYAMKKVQEMPAPESLNYLNLSEELVKKYKVQEIGKETLGDRECIKYSQEISQMGHVAKVTVWVWKGIPIKTVSEIGNMTMTTEAVEIQENAYVFPQLFDIPEF